MRKFCFLILILIFANISFAQTKNEQAEKSIKIAVIDTDVFFDESTGIIELILAKKKLDKEFEPYNQDLALSEKKIEQCSKEIKNIAEDMNSPEPKPQANFGSISMRDRVSKCENLIKGTKDKREEVKLLYEKRRLEMSADIDKKVETALKLFAKQNRYSIVLDSSKINSSVIIIDGETVDITKDFIQFYKDQSINKEAQ